MLVKLIWMIRAICYKPFMGQFGLYSYIGQPFYMRGFKNICFGKKVRIYPGARIESLGNGKIVIGDDVSIGQCLHLIASKKVLIEKNVTLSANVFISDVEHDYTEIGIHVMNQKLITSTAVIGENCFIGYGAVIRAGTVLGKQCVVGANSVVKGVFPDGCVIAGNPAKIIKRYDAGSQKWERVNSGIL